MSRSSSCLVFFRGPTTLEQVAERLTKARLLVTRDGDALVVKYPDAPELVIGLSDAPHVVLEAAELAERNPEHAELAHCDRRFEVFVPDLEAALDETNTLAEVQMTLGDMTKGYVFNSWNGLFQPR